MIDYATIAHTSGAFPDVISINSTGPGALDGTPYIKSVIDDLWGASQALMDAAELTPNAVTESATASQRLEALRCVLGYPGEVLAWMGNEADPSTLGIRLLPLNGQTILIASYPELVASTYVGDTDNPTASAFFKTSDTPGTVRDTAGPYFVLPDLRGAFMRGLDTSGTVDPDGASRDIGNFQEWAIFDHRHNIRHSLGIFNVYFSTITLGGSAEMMDAQSPGSPIGQAWAQTIYDSTGGSFSKQNISESRPINYTCRWCIRY